MKENIAKTTFPIVLLTLIFFNSCSIGQELRRNSLDSTNLSSLVLSGYGSSTYDNDSIQTYLDELKDLNSNTASFLYTCYVKNQNDPNINCNSYDTPQLSKLSQAILMAKSRGFSINLRVYVDLLDTNWRCYWNPTDKNKVFSSLKTQLKKIATFAEDLKVELLIIGAEYCELTKKSYTAKWTEIISEIRLEYSGKITYGANWGPINGSTEWKHINFWDDLDFVGIDHYRPLPDKLIGSQIEAFQVKYFSEYQSFAKLINKPILITEIGFPGHELGHRSPFEWRLKGRSNEKRQASNYSQTLKAIKRFKEISGVFIWRKESKSPKLMQQYNKDALGFELYKRKAWFEIQNFFSHY